MAIQASLDSSSTSNSNQSESQPVLPPERAPPVRPICGSSSTSSPLPLIEDSFPPLSDREPPEASSKYAKAVVQGSVAPSRLGGEAFPPLPGAFEAAKITPSAPPGKPTIVAHLREQSKAAAVAVRPRAHDPRPSFPINSPQLWPTPAQEFKTSNPSSSRSTSQPRSTINDTSGSTSSLSAKKFIDKKEPTFPSNQSSRGLSHSSSAPDLRATNDDNIRVANKTLVERIRTDLGMDEDKFSAFKHISSEYREGLTDAWEYLSYVEQFGLLHLVPELARLCPDPQKQRELLASYSIKQKKGGSGSSSGKPQFKGKGKSVAAPLPPASRTDPLADGILEAVKKLQSNYEQKEEEVLSKDGYRSNPLPADVSGSDQGSSKKSQRSKKVSKFHRMRLGSDGSVIPDAVEEEPPGPSEVEGIPVSGVWRRGGGLKLFPSTGRQTK